MKWLLFTNAMQMTLMTDVGEESNGRYVTDTCGVNTTNATFQIVATMWGISSNENQCSSWTSDTSGEFKVSSTASTRTPLEIPARTNHVVS